MSCSLRSYMHRTAWCVIIVGLLSWSGCGVELHEVPRGDGGGVTADGGTGTADGGRASDAGPVGDGGGNEMCGTTTCDPGMVCCNASCGICAPPGAGCIALACVDGGFPTDAGSCTTPILCVAPPAGCRYVGASCTSCGELVCENVCGTIAGLACGRNEWCDFDDCRISDAAGVCRRRPDVCTDEVDPVCGCDGRTYSNQCAAHAAGADVLRAGECDDDR